MEANENYCAFLRGVNVNGRKMNMREVCEVFSNVGMRDAASVLATGNILFQSERPRSELRDVLQEAMSARFAYPVYLFVKSAEEIREMLRSCPFSPEADLHRYVFICEPGFEARLSDAFQTITPIEREAAEVKSGIFYWQVPKGATIDAGFSSALARRDLQSLFTSRNLNTMERVAAKLSR